MLSLALVSTLVLAGCGPLGGDDDEPTATTETISQPTTAVEATIPGTPESGLTDIEAGESTPIVSVATPDVPDAGMVDATPVATDQVPTAFEGSPTTPGQGVTDPTPEPGAEGVAAESDAAFTGSDGTSGATPDQDGPAATPVNGATPAAEVDLLDVEPVEVSSCEPESIPPFGTEQAEFLTVVDVNFRVGPGADCDSLGDGPIGINIPVTVLSNPVVRVDDDELVWIQVQIVDQIGWIVADAIEPAP